MLSRGFHSTSHGENTIQCDNSLLEDTLTEILQPRVPEQNIQDTAVLRGSIAAKALELTKLSLPFQTRDIGIR